MTAPADLVLPSSLKAPSTNGIMSASKLLPG